MRKKDGRKISRSEIEIIKRIPGYYVGARERLFGLGKKSRRNVESIRWVIVVIPRTFHSSLSRRTQKHAKHNKQTISLSMRWKMHQRTLAGRCERGWEIVDCAGVECWQLEKSKHRKMVYLHFTDESAVENNVLSHQINLCWAERLFPVLCVSYTHNVFTQSC